MIKTLTETGPNGPITGTVEVIINGSDSYNGVVTNPDGKGINSFKIEGKLEGVVVMEVNNGSQISFFGALHAVESAVRVEIFKKKQSETLFKLEELMQKKGYQ